MNRFICDGHEYRVIGHGLPIDFHELKNNYGSRVATMQRSPCGEYWIFETECGIDLGQIHENAIEDNLLNQELVNRYVAWAMDNDTVEAHA